MKTQNRFQLFINAAIKRAERWAIQNPGQSYRKIVIRENGSYSLVSGAFFDEACSSSDWVGELFAIKEPRSAVYSAFNVR